ncbi:putative CHY-type Zn-finger protein [Pullulanibacillus pueri]|uniref:CHY zinc finger protein n=1 Tax=Pullulanibacillus pueri TaxID=1437324 RepID=UPI0016647A11|nr:CHY zinc finger protein [Pullulanibacillus pueri]MBM7680764.1 putative CHY-type Zn-finger protein [Pullulanibacillus pueri]
MPKVYGALVDAETRCRHYASERDIIAIKFKCCQKYYPCYHCHNEAEDHPIEVWEKESFAEKAILCGVCKYEHTIHEYLDTQHCLNCGSSFNPGCALHYPIYFKI